MRLVLIGAAAGAALVSVAAAGLAQTPGSGENQGKMPSAHPGGSSSPSGQSTGERGREPNGKAEKAQPSQGKSAQEHREAPKASEAPGRTAPKSSEGPAEKQRPKASERNDTDKKAPKSSETRPEKGTPKATENRPEKGAPKSSETRPEKGAPKSTETQPGKGAPKSTENRPDNRQGGRVQVSEQQRTSVREHLMREGKFQKTKIDVRLNVGTRVPRSVRLQPLPVAIVNLAPSYRGYDYIVTEDDRICIVDPRSYEVVDVITTGTQQAGRPPAGARLTLSQEQMRFVAGHVSREQRANVRVRLALGAEVPREVELLDFPRDVTAEVPKLDGYRYIVSENDVVIVDPNSRDVALVISD
jgi:hypothetical protein